jgi:hypothetical protein
MKTYEAMGNVLNKKELAFIQQKEGEETSSEGVRAAAFIYVERMFTLNERLTFSLPNNNPKIQEKLLEIEGEY